MYKIRCKGCMEELQEGQETCPYCGYKVGTQPVEVFHLQPGTILANKYLVGKAVGYGGFGVTYIGYDTVLERRVAIKEYLPGEFATRVPGQEMVTIYEGEKHEQFDSGIDKFIDEAKRLGKFSHTDGIVHIYDSFFANATAYIVMEYIDGITLKEKISREGKLSLEESLEIIKPIIEALKEVHKENILHRDIAPDNIMIGNDGKVSLIDFGASRFATTTYSKSLSVLIKAGYAPVEQYQSRGNQGPWSDVYSLAATFYTMLTGVAPQESIDRGEQDLVKPPSKMGAKVSKSMDNAIMNALNLRPENRTQTMEDFENELFSQKEVIRIFDEKEREDTGKWPGWVKAGLGISAVAIFAFLILLGTGVLSVKQGMRDTASIEKVVPNVINKTQEEAEKQIKKQGFEPYTKPGDYDDTVEYGRVLYQNPASGSQALEGDFVTVIYCLGPDKRDWVVLPDLSDYAKSAAVSQLSELGIEYEVIEKESDVATGLVCDMNPKAGTELKKGDKVQIYVSSGNGKNDVTGGTNTDEEYEVEDLSGKDFETAKKELQEKGITLAKAGEEYSLDVRKAGGILSQSPAAGTKILPGEDRIITVKVSLGDEKAIPDQIVNTMQKAAEDRLKKEGFTNIKINSIHDNSDAGMVIGISPKEKSICKLDKEIILTVSSGPDMSNMGQASGEALQQTPEPQWSNWVSTLPAGVSESNYEIIVESRYKDLRTEETTDDSRAATLSNQGWNLVNSEKLYSSWGDASEWTDAVYEESDTRMKVDTRTRYKETTTANSPSLSGWTQYGNRREEPSDADTGWSGWSETAVEASETESGCVEVQTQQTPNVRTRYKYHVYHIFPEYQNKGYGIAFTKNRSSAEAAGPEGVAFEEVFQYSDDYLGEEWQRYDFGGNPKYAYLCEEQYDDGYKTEYRSRQVMFIYSFYRWTDNVVSGAETKTEYQYKERQFLGTKYIYQKWDDSWSAWEEGNMQSTDTRQVDKHYKYKAK